MTKILHLGLNRYTSMPVLLTFYKYFIIDVSHFNIDNSNIFNIPWNSFRAVLTEVTMFATWPNTVANSSKPNRSCAITKTYSPLLRGRGRSPVNFVKLSSFKKTIKNKNEVHTKDNNKSNKNNVSTLPRYIFGNNLFIFYLCVISKPYI